MKKLFFFFCLTLPLGLFSQGSHWHLSGSIHGKYPVSMDVVWNGTDLSGYYHYLKVGQPISIQGRMEGKRFWFTEYGGADRQESGRFTGSIQADGIWKGTWADASGKTEYSFSLKEGEAEGSQTFKVWVWDQMFPLYDGPERPSAQLQTTYLELQNAAENPALEANFRTHFFGPDHKGEGPEVLNHAYQEEYLQNYRELQKDYPSPDDCFACDWTRIRACVPVYNDRNILSMEINWYEFSGGAHGIHGSDYWVFDAQLGRQLRLDDLFANSEDPALISLLDRSYLQAMGLPEDQALGELLFVQHLYPASNFFLSHGGVGFYYGLYEIAPYVAGTTTVFVPLEDLEPFLKADSPIRRLLP